MRCHLSICLLTLVGLAVLTSATSSAAADRKPIKVFILSGQSNMQGKAKVSLLEHQIKTPPTDKRFKHFHKDGKWIERDDVWINFLNRRGKLTVGYGSRNCIGVELEFGHVMGNHFEEPVLLIKTAWGGKSIGRDFRPPSSGLPSDDKLKEFVAQTNERNKKRKRPAVTLDDVKKQYGHYYRLMMTEIDETLGNLKTRFPQYEGQGYEIAGFVWFQGYNDMFDPDFRADYGKHMANFIRDVRKDLKQPQLPFVIGLLGQNGFKPANDRMAAVKKAQWDVQFLPEFKGNVKSIKTDVFWDKAADAQFPTWRENFEAWQKVGSDRPYHYLGSTLTFSDIGKAFAQTTLELMKEK